MKRVSYVRAAARKSKEKLRKRLSEDPVFREQWLAREASLQKLRRHKKGISKKYIKSKRESLSS